MEAEFKCNEIRKFSVTLLKWSINQLKSYSSSTWNKADQTQDWHMLKFWYNIGWYNIKFY